MDGNAILSALYMLASVEHFLALLTGVGLGLVVGIIPGLGGLVGLSLLLPFMFGMDPTLALPMMIGLLAPTTTSDTFPAILMGIPGTAASQATVVDGFPLARDGQAARALGAAFTSSMIGGIVGALLLSVAIFFARPLVMAMGFAEQMLLVVLALTMVGSLTGSDPIKGIGAGCIGLLIGTIGVAPATGIERTTFGSLYLIDGLALTVVALGLFALPEIFDLLRSKGAIAKNATLSSGIGRGIRDALRNWWLVLRCSGLGALIGALPGLGGTVVDWIAYGFTIQTSKVRDRFGKGDIRGVIGPESANNAKEGGALIPTLLFGIPGSGSMAILLGGLVMIGVEPGVAIFHNDLNLAYLIIWSLALANIMGAIFALAATRQIAKLTTIRFELIAVVLLVAVVFAATQATRSWNDVLLLVTIGVLGVLFKTGGWSRPALLIGYFLSPELETTLYQTVQVYGFDFFARPQSVFLIALIVISVTAAIRIGRPRKAAADTKPKKNDTASTGEPAPDGTVALGLGIAGVAFAGIVAVTVLDQPFLGRVYPLTIAAITAVLSAVVLLRQLRAGIGTGAPESATYVQPFALFLTLLAFIALLGLPIGGGAFALVTLLRRKDLGLQSVLISAALAFAMPAFFGYALNLRSPGGLVPMLLDLPNYVGG